ncbi:MAG: ferrous iron transport protein B [Candidatus Aureabacteria bacterium]|nr:ferrous iron transport protein B [Candidatus Auribacterota bacterium]
MMKKKITVALAGNPNSGKTTIFNELTGSNQKIANYPGVTVEKKEGVFDFQGYTVSLVDLPGTYSLTANSIDEIIARDFLIEEKPDIVINVIDSSNLERSLYLTMQLMQLKVPLVLAFNMYDAALKLGVSINRELISELLGIVSVFTVATKKSGIIELMEKSILLYEGKLGNRNVTVNYGVDIEKELNLLETIINRDSRLSGKYPAKWLAVKIIEQDGQILKKIQDSPVYQEIKKQQSESIKKLKSIYADDVFVLMSDRRYGFISGACSEAVKITKEDRHTISDVIDKVLIHRFFGIPIFLLSMWLIFRLTFSLSQPLINLIHSGLNILGSVIGSFMADGSLIRSFIVDGIIGGVGGVLSLVPVIMLLFFAIAVLEYSGYMARIAFIMDRLMHKIGLHGRSFIPMLLGFGCNVPGIMAARSIEDYNDRMVTILINPFMSCGARLPVYAIFIGAFFPEKMAGNVLFSIYLVGIIVAVVVAKIFRAYVFKGETESFVMELPPYRIPTIKLVVMHMWEKVYSYLNKAGTIIFIGCVFIWFLSNYPANVNYSKDYGGLIKKAEETGSRSKVEELQAEKAKESLEKSYAGTMGKKISPLLRPLGIYDWKVSVSLIGGFVAKEIIIGTLATLYSVGNPSEIHMSLQESLKQSRFPDGSRMYAPLNAYSLMIFVLLYVPCIASIAVIKRETNSWFWPIFTAVYTTSIAWIVAFSVFQIGRFLGFGI